MTKPIARHCYTCGALKPPSHFSKTQSSCKECIRAKNRRRKYGLTDELFREMLSKQDSRCAICYDYLDDMRQPHIDHDHDTMQVRGILCRHCNLMLGHARDNPQNLIKALTYLRKYGR